MYASSMKLALILALLAAASVAAAQSLESSPSLQPNGPQVQPAPSDPQGGPQVQPVPGLQPADGPQFQPAPTVQPSASTDDSSSPQSGTGGDLVLLTLVNGLGDASDPRKEATEGDRLTFAVYSQAPVERMPFILAQLHRSDAVLQAPYPGIALDPSVEGVMVTIEAGEGYSPADPAVGFRSGVDVPPDLHGWSVQMQGFLISPLAKNGIFESTAAHEIVIQ